MFFALEGISIPEPDVLRKSRLVFTLIVRLRAKCVTVVPFWWTNPKLAFLTMAVAVRPVLPSPPGGEESGIS